MKSLHKSQSGIVSFFVVMIIMIVLTLIVLAFSQLVRREQRQTLDRQLQAQALYAAESGINDAIDWLESNQIDSDNWNDNCAGPGSFIEVASLNPQLDTAPDGVTSYSCLLVDLAPSELSYDIPTEESAIVRLQPSSSSVNRLVINWTGDGTDLSACPAVGSYTGGGSLNAAGSGCEIGVLRIEIVPFNDPKSRDQLINERFIAFAQPGGSPSSVTWGSATGREQGRSVGSTDCTGPNGCTLTITGVPNITRGYMRISSIYRDANVTVQPFNGSTALSMDGAQIAIDATGRSNDVLHRVRANVSVASAGDGPAPEFAVQSRRTLCKRFNLVDSPATASPALPIGFSDPNNYCNPTSP